MSRHSFEIALERIARCGLQLVGAVVLDVHATMQRSKALRFENIEQLAQQGYVILCPDSSVPILQFCQQKLTAVPGKRRRDFPGALRDLHGPASAKSCRVSLLDGGL